MEQLERYAAYAQSTWSFSTAWTISPLVLFVTLLLLGVSLRRMRWSPTSAFAASIPAGLLILPQTLIWGLTLLLIPLVLIWDGRGRWGATSVWALGWFLMLGIRIQDWWKVESLVLALVTLAVVAFTSRTPRLAERPESARLT
jgi:hypothetical protein